MFSAQKKFGNKYYRLWDIMPPSPKAKHVAQSYAKDLRREGYLVRVVKGKFDGKTVYAVYRRQSEGKKVYGLKMKSKPY